MAKILVVDDAVFFRTMLKDLLTLEGHEVVLAEDGDQAIDLAQKHGASLNLMILDMILPKKTGLEVLMELHDMNLKILCMTGSTQIGELDTLTEMGAAAVLNKSAKPEEILGCIKGLIGAL